MKKFLKYFAALIGLLLIVAAGFFIYVARVLDRDIPLEGRSAAELENVLEGQQTDMDEVNGSTVTSQAYLKAIKNTLDPQEEEIK